MKNKKKKSVPKLRMGTAGQGIKTFTRLMTDNKYNRKKFKKDTKQLIKENY